MPSEQQSIVLKPRTCSEQANTQPGPRHRSWLRVRSGETRTSGVLHHARSDASDRDSLQVIVESLDRNSWHVRRQFLNKTRSKDALIWALGRHRGWCSRDPVVSIVTILTPSLHHKSRVLADFNHSRPLPSSSDQCRSWSYK